MAELANAFLRPTGKNAFEVLDPSVMDLLNAVIRKAPENGVDIVLGAVDFSQIGRVWEVARNTAPAVTTALSQAGPAVVAAIKGRLARPNRIVGFQGGPRLLPWTEEARLAAALSLANALKSADMLELVRTLSSEMIAAWSGRGISINDGVEALRALERLSWPPLKAPKLERQLMTTLVAQAQRGCRSDELREIIGVVELEGPEKAVTLAALQAAFEICRQDIASEIDECRKEDEFKGLEEDYELFASSLGVDVSSELERLQVAYSEYNDYEEQRADQMMDEYKERSREARASEDSIRDLFGSLRGDRGD